MTDHTVGQFMDKLQKSGPIRLDGMVFRYLKTFKEGEWEPVEDD